jgi:fermentation-respiration switch protein FrsA (DUF1100 family)
MLRRIAFAGAVIAAAVALVAGAAEAGTGTNYDSPDQAGYAATAGDLVYAGAHITLPNALAFARELGTVEFGVELWNNSTVVDLGVVACTDNTCKPGGKAEGRYYWPVFRIFNKKTGKLICSAALRNCPDSDPQGWAHTAFRPGTSLDITLSYSSGLLDPSIATNTADIDYDTFALGSGVSFSQARIAAEFGSSPFAPAPFNAPAKAIRLGTFFEPAGPPYEAELASRNSNGTTIHSSCLGGSWFTRHALLLTKSGTATHVRARPGGLSGANGCDFSVFLEPL